jgi:two-component system, chemotaxis family, sensor kinase CheA
MLGQMLVQQGKVQPQDLESALRQQRKGDPLRIGEILVEKGIIATQDIREAVTALQETKTPVIGDSTIRVDVALLDKLMTSVGELVLARNQILQYTSKLDDAGFVSTAQRLNLITTELQESVMKTRMQPIGNVWAKFPRVVRDLASQLGKQVRIEMEGKETELDKTIVEAIKDPLTHLVRNSVDHGIEKPAGRTAAGKPEEGCLMLRAFHEGPGQHRNYRRRGRHQCRSYSPQSGGTRIGHCRSGVAHERSRSNANDHVARLLNCRASHQRFRSWCRDGRGENKYRANRWNARPKSKPGQGTTITIKIPLTLAIIPALVVTSDGDRYAIPQVSLFELVRLEGEQVRREIEFVHGAPVYRLRGKLLPLLYLFEQLGRKRKPEEYA